jgi:hypothetical protein
MARFLAVVLLALLIISPETFAQCEGSSGLRWDFDEEEKGINVFSLLGNLVTPQIVRDTKEIRTYVRDPRFKELTKLCGDMRAVDAIYLKALRIAEYNIARALVISMMATLEHQNIEVRTGFAGSIPLPLTFEEDHLFNARTGNLPSRLYWDSPQTEYGDKDKLQHFFASAYIAYVTGSPELARTAGNFVEWGEAKFIVGGVDDPRDRRANKQGEMLGHDLIYAKTLLPSDYFSLPVE